MKQINSKNLTPLPPFPRREGGFKASSCFGATVYTQVIPTERFAIESLLFLKVPHPTPPRGSGEGTNFSGVPPIHRGGLGWGNLRNNRHQITCVYTVS